MEILNRYESCGFLYVLEGGGNEISIYYNRLLGEWDEVFCAYRLGLREGKVHQVGDLLATARQRAPFYMVVCGQLEVLVQVQREMERLRDVSVELYLNGYTNFYFIDIFPSSRSKADGLLKLQELTGASELVAFGDNFSDMTMLLAADRAYVPKNGVAAAKGIATEVLDYAYRDSVAHFLAREMGWE